MAPMGRSITLWAHVMLLLVALPHLALCLRFRAQGASPGQPGQAQGAQGANTLAGQGANPSAAQKIAPRGHPLYLGSPVGIRYGGGGVLTQPIRVYIYWLGEFTTTQKGLVRNFVNSLSEQGNAQVTVANWWNVTTQYTNAQGVPVSSHVSLAGEYSLLTARHVRSDVTGMNRVLNGWRGVRGLIEGTIRGGVFPLDPQGVYALITASAFMQVGNPASNSLSFCSSYCGWHSSFNLASTKIKYLWVGTADRLCPGACIPPPLTSGGLSPPSGDRGIHGVINMLAHELTEAATNPGGGSWRTSTGDENADLCEWKMGNVQVGPGNVGFNMVGLGGTRYLVQSNWDPTRGVCTLGV